MPPKHCQISAGQATALGLQFSVNSILSWTVASGLSQFSQGATKHEGWGTQGLVHQILGFLAIP